VDAFSGDFNCLDLCTKRSIRLVEAHVDGDVFHGHEERAALQTLEIFDEIHIPAEDVTDLGNDIVLLAGRARFKGHASGLDVEAYAANLWTVRDGKVSHFRFYQSKEDALADV
jgi:ketosteroid isomerase-like protein